MRLILTAALLLATSPALADTSTPTGTPPKPAKGSPDEVICHREAETGSLIPARRICMTRAQLQVQADTAHSQATEIDVRGRITTCTQPGGC